MINKNINFYLKMIFKNLIKNLIKLFIINPQLFVKIMIIRNFNKDFQKCKKFLTLKN